jgi:hypothetical protein
MDGDDWYGLTVRTRAGTMLARTRTGARPPLRRRRVREGEERQDATS